MMAASAKVFASGNHSSDGEWTVVKPRRGKQRRQVMNLPKILDVEEHWSPAESETDLERVSKIVQKLGTCLKKMEGSSFFHSFIEQVEGLDISACFCRAMGTEMKVRMVIYGIGSIESYENPRLQLSLALLMRRKFDFIGEIEVFDPVLSATESRVLEELGCSVLSINEHGRRPTSKPTLFYMPHCDAALYDNLLHANWSANRLSKIILLGNSFGSYEHSSSEFRNSHIVPSLRHVLAVRKFTDEFKIQVVSDDYFRAFHDSSWHFFGNVHNAELPCICP